jgi:hypothetical protein
MIADLRKPNGALNVPGLYAKVARPRAKQLARIRTQAGAFPQPARPS